jgi:uncharacterized phage protein (TIGR01671 family)
MSRIIKFRVWDNVDYMSTFTLDDVMQRKIVFTSDCHVMQFTGLADKHGIDIYEGDIIYIPLYGNAIIIWNDDVCSFQYAYHAIGKGTSIGGRMTNTMYKHESIIKYEIIGNIYQNPEFIK